MPIPTPKGGPTSLPADTTAGWRGDPRQLTGLAAQPDPMHVHHPWPGRAMPSKGSKREDHGEDLQSTNQRNGTTAGMYESPLRRQTPSSGDGTGQ